MAWNRPSEGKREEGRGKREEGTSLVRGIVAALIVVVGAGIAAWFLWPDAKHPLSTSTSTSTSLIKEVKPAAAPKPTVGKKAEPVVKEEVAVTNDPDKVIRVGKDGKPLTIPPAWERKLRDRKKNPPKSIFNHMAESYLAMFLNPAQSVPPPPDNFTDAQIQAMLIEKIEIDREKDTEDEIRQKEGVTAMKKELVQWIKDGGTFNSYLKELQHRQENEAMQMNEARKMITESMEKGDVEEAKQLYDRINAHFKEKCMPKVNVSPKYRKLLDERNNEQ